MCVVHFYLVAPPEYPAMARAPPAEAKAWPQFARRIAEERPDDWFVLLDVASRETGIIFTSLLFLQGPYACDASFFTSFSCDTHMSAQSHLCRTRLWTEQVVGGFILTFSCGLTSDFASPLDPSLSSLLVSFALVPLPLWSCCSRRTSGPRSLPA